MTVAEQLVLAQQELEDEKKRQAAARAAEGTSEVLPPAPTVDPVSKVLNTVENTANYVTKEAVPNLIRGSFAAPVWGLKFAAKFLAAPLIGTEPAQEQLIEAKDAAADVAHAIWSDPANAAPLIGMVAGGALGQRVGMPGTGASVGAGIGTLLNNVVHGKSWDAKDTGDVAMAPIANLPWSFAGAALRGVKGVDKLVTKANTIFKSTALTPEQIDKADALIATARATSDAKRTAANYTRPVRTLARLDPQSVDPGTTSMTQSSFFTKPDEFKQKVLFKTSLAGPRVAVRKKEVERSLSEQPNPNQLEMFMTHQMADTGLEPAATGGLLGDTQGITATGRRAPELPSMAEEAADTMSQPKLFQPNRFGKRVMKPTSERPDREKPVGPDLPNKNQGEMFPPPRMGDTGFEPASETGLLGETQGIRAKGEGQTPLFPAPEKFRQKGLFPIKGQHMVLDDALPDPVQVFPTTAREPGNRFRQPKLLRRERLKQLVLPRDERWRQKSLFDKHGRPAKGTTEPVKEAEQLDLMMPRQLQPAPGMKTGEIPPTALYAVNAPKEAEQLGLLFPRRLRPAPEAKNGDVVSNLRSIKATRMGKQLNLGLMPKKELTVMSHSDDIPVNSLFKTRPLKMGDTGREAPGIGGLLGDTVGKKSHGKDQEFLFPKADPHWLDAAAKEQRRQGLIVRAKGQIEGHIAEQAMRLQNEADIAKNPLMADMEADRLHLARLSVLDPGYLQPDVNPFSQALRSTGLSASIANPHHRLIKDLGPEGQHVSQLTMHAHDLHTTATYKLQTQAHAIMDEFNVQEHDLHSHGLLHTLMEHPELNDAMKTVGMPTGVAGKKIRARDVVKDFEVKVGQRLNILPQDYDRLHEMHQFSDKLRSEVLNPAWAFMLKQSTDPHSVAQYNMRYMFPSFTSKRGALEVQGDLKAIAKAYGSLSEPEKLQSHGKMLMQQHDALTMKLKIAAKAADKEDLRRSQASQTLYKKGMKPGEVFNSAYTNKATDMSFGTGMRSSIDDYISGFLKKAVYDPVNAKLNETIRTAPWDADTKRWATAFTLDQQGTRRQVQSLHLTQKLQKIPLLGKYIKDDSLENAVNTAGQYNATVTLGLNPRYYPINAMQPLIMGYGVLGADGLAHGFARMITNWPKAYKQAMNDGVVQGGLEHMWTEGKTTSRGHVLTRFTKAVMGSVSKALVASETINKVWMNEGGLYRAAKEGLTGRAAVNRARDIARLINPGFNAAERPTSTGTFYGSTLLRYKGYSMQYVSYVKHLLTHDKRAAAETLAMVAALSGTNGIPGYGMAQDILAKHFNYNMPSVSPADEVLHTNGLSASFSPWMNLPGVTEEATWEDAAGPVVGPLVAVGNAIHDDNWQGSLGAAAGKLVGGGIMRPARGIAEYARGGLTTTPSGKPMIQRSNSDIAKYIFNVGPSAKGQAYDLQDKVMRAYDAQDDAGLSVALDKAGEGGLLNPGQGMRTARAKQKAEEKRKSVMDALMGR